MMNEDNLLLKMWQVNWHKIERSVMAFIFLSLFFMLLGCSNNVVAYNDTGSSNKAVLAKIESQFQQWKNTPYRVGGNSTKGVDCSGFVKNFYSTKLQQELPRMTTLQAKLGTKVSQPQAGDLLFFKTGRGPNGMHVGIYYKNGIFLHASTSRGVEYADLNSSYWQDTYVMTKRVLR